MIAGAQHNYWTNSGAPMGRMLRRPFHSDLYWGDDGFQAVQKIMRVAIRFHHTQCPVEYMHGLLEKYGYDTPEDLREAFDHPQKRLMASPYLLECGCAWAHHQPALRNALILGLSTNSIYDPSRPVVWTRASLSRSLELVDTAGFYQ
jgi:hypothetical protein